MERRSPPRQPSGLGGGARSRSRASSAASAPYLLILPVVVTIAAILGYPLYHLARLSFQKYGLFELIERHGTGVGWANYSSVLHDSVFWHVAAADGRLHDRERRA